MNARCFATAALALTPCACSTTPSVRPQQPQPLVQVSCPPLVPLADDSFGAWVLWAQYAAGQYRVCRAAALGEH
jgi:hypothetical protein